MEKFIKEEKNKTNYDTIKEDTLKILIADDENDCCQEIINILNKYNEYEIVGVANTDEEEIMMIENLNPDVVITDLLRNDEMTGWYIIKEHAKNKDKLKFIIISYAQYDSYMSSYYNVMEFIGKYPKINEEKLIATLKKALTEKLSQDKHKTT